MFMCIITGLCLFYLQINFTDDMIEIQSSLKLDCISTLAAICVLLETLLSLKNSGKDKLASFSLDMTSEQVFFILLVVI